MNKLEMIREIQGDITYSNEATKLNVEKNMMRNKKWWVERVYNEYRADAMGAEMRRFYLNLLIVW